MLGLWTSEYNTSHNPQDHNHNFHCNKNFKSVTFILVLTCPVIDSTSYLMTILMKLKGLYLWPFLESFSRYSSFVSCCLLVTKSVTMKPLPVLWDGSWIFSPFTLSSTAMRPCVDRANQEPPSFPGSRSRPLLQEHVYVAYYICAVYILKNNLCPFKLQCMGLCACLFCHTLTDCFRIKKFSNTTFTSCPNKTITWCRLFCSVLAGVLELPWKSLQMVLVQVIVNYITSHYTLWPNTVL